MAEAATSAVTALATEIITFDGTRSGTEDARAPLLKSAICWTM